ncbi:MAG: nitroreductase family deazaflavin-dependent oxidoreductase [Pseudomonadales bacterium]
MSEKDAAVLGFASVKELLTFNKSIIEEFRANNGVCGGRFEGNPMILLTMTGAKSGRELTTPLSYCADGDECIIFASAGGSPKHPNWYFNIVANMDVTVERGGEKYAAKAVLTTGEERELAFNKMVTELPRFGEYQENTDRQIPVFRLVRS